MVSNITNQYPKSYINGLEVFTNHINEYGDFTEEYSKKWWDTILFIDAEASSIHSNYEYYQINS